jgi:hypothetical protein
MIICAFENSPSIPSFLVTKIVYNLNLDIFFTCWSHFFLNSPYFKSFAVFITCTHILTYLWNRLLIDFYLCVYDRVCKVPRVLFNFLRFPPPNIVENGVKHHNPNTYLCIPFGENGFEHSQIMILRCNTETYYLYNILFLIPPLVSSFFSDH